jgi:hypothetical protein
MIEANTNVTPLASDTGRLLLASPKINHISVPKANMMYIDNEMADVSFVRIVLMACGKNEVVVKKAATNPEAVIQFILCFII